MSTDNEELQQLTEQEIRYFPINLAEMRRYFDEDPEMCAAQRHMTPDECGRVRFAVGAKVYADRCPKGGFKFVVVGVEVPDGYEKIVDFEDVLRYFRENPDAEAGKRTLSSAECERAGFANGGYVVALQEPDGRIVFSIIQGEMPEIDEEAD